MDLAKCYEFFQPEMARDKVHIVGCGATGSTIAELLARFGLTNFVLWDFDNIEPHNITNQLYTNKDLYKEKVDALLEHLIEINPEISNNTVLERNGWDGELLNGYVFLCVDNIELMKKIVQTNKYNFNTIAMFNTRMRLIDAQIYSADWSSPKSVERLLSTMNFTSEEAQAETPVSACNITLSVAPTVRIVSALAVQNFINFVKGNPLKQTMFFELENFTFDSFE